MDFNWRFSVLMFQMSAFSGPQELVQVISDAFVVLDWDDQMLAQKLMPSSATHRQPPGDAPRDVRRACAHLLSAALAWSEFR